jgi:ribose 5-phosphate isomerase A
VAYNSKKMVVVADYRKNSKQLGEKWRAGVPIEVIPLAHVPIANRLKLMGGKPILRHDKNNKSNNLLIYGD